MNFHFSELLANLLMKKALAKENADGQSIRHNKKPSTERLYKPKISCTMKGKVIV